MRTNQWEYNGKKGHAAEELEGEVLVSYDFKVIKDQPDPEVSFTETWIEIELKSVEAVLMGRGHDLLPTLTMKEIEKLKAEIQNRYHS